MAIDKVYKLERKLNALHRKPDKGSAGKKKVDLLNELAAEYLPSNLVDAEKYAKSALSLARKLDYRKGIAKGYLHIGQVHLLKGMFDKTLQFAGKSLEISCTINDNENIANAHHIIGTAKTRLGKYEQAQTHNINAMQIRRERKDKRGIAFSYVNIGNVYFQLGEYDDALSNYKDALEIFSKMDDKHNIAKAFGNMGQVYFRRSEYEKALEHYLESLKMVKQIGDKESAAMFYSNIGLVYEEQGDYVEAFKYYFEALRTWEEIDNRFGIAGTLSNLGNVYDMQKDYDNALQCYQKSSKILEEIGNKHFAAITYDNIADTYRKMGDYEASLKHISKALEIFKEINDKYGIARSNRTIGVLYQQLGQDGKALEHHNKALQLSEELGNNEGIAASYMEIANTHSRLKQWDLAYRYFQKSLKLAEEIRDKILQKEILANISRFFETQDDFRQALDYHKKYTDLKEEIFNSEKSQQITEMSAKYEAEKKEKEAEIYHLRNVKLRKEIKERKKIERELKKHRDQLEKLVDKRTVELKKELAKRKRVEKELVKHQDQLVTLNHVLSLVEERQRRKTAAYLHDNISQALSLAIFKIRSLQETVPVKSVKKELVEIKRIVAQTNQHTRSLTFEISPPVLYELGLEPALEWVVGQFQAQHSIKSIFENDGSSKPLKDETGILLFQAVRELLNNVSKHARAQTVKVSTVKDNKTIRISVEDDGTGFDPGILGLKITRNEGFGLFNIKERLHYLGGRLEVNSKSGKGTSVVLIAPLKTTPASTKRKR